MIWIIFWQNVCVKSSTIIAELKGMADAKKAAFFPKFFKTGKGEYGEGDIFIGVTVPQVRTVAMKYRDISLDVIQKLINDPVHEVRLLGFIILTLQYARAGEPKQQAIVDFYLKNLTKANNWDLVDASCYKILGEHLLTRDRKILSRLAASKNLWEQRVAIVSTLAFIRAGETKDVLTIATLLLSHKHDLIHKAVGWMLREMGKKDERVLRRFLDTHAPTMPRTALRYAIEKLPPKDRASYLAMKY